MRAALVPLQFYEVQICSLSLDHVPCWFLVFRSFTLKFLVSFCDVMEKRAKSSLVPDVNLIHLVQSGTGRNIFKATCTNTKKNTWARILTQMATCKQLFTQRLLVALSLLLTFVHYYYIIYIHTYVQTIHIFFIYIYDKHVIITRVSFSKECLTLQWKMLSQRITLVSLFS